MTLERGARVVGACLQGVALGTLLLLAVLRLVALVGWVNPFRYQGF